MSTLREDLSLFDAQLFVVVDGAVFEDLPSILGSIGLQGRSLFLFGAGTAEDRHSPRLVALPSADDRRSAALLALCDSYKTGVYWACASGEEALYKHLRTLNVVQLPSEETVFFRHADPSVTRSVVQILNPDQVRAFFGPAGSVYVYGRAFHADLVGTQR